jgi:hypothetical protein
MLFVGVLSYSRRVYVRAFRSQRHDDWRVRADLVSQLEARERTHPRHRIQVDRLGPERQIDGNGPDRGPARGRGPGLSR